MTLFTKDNNNIDLDTAQNKVVAPNSGAFIWRCLGFPTLHAGLVRLRSGRKLFQRPNKCLPVGDSIIRSSVRGRFPEHTRQNCSGKYCGSLVSQLFFLNVDPARMRTLKSDLRLAFWFSKNAALARRIWTALWHSATAVARLGTAVALNNRHERQTREYSLLSSGAESGREWMVSFKRASRRQIFNPKMCFFISWNLSSLRLR